MKVRHSCRRGVVPAEHRQMLTTGLTSISCMCISYSSGGGDIVSKFSVWNLSLRKKEACFKARNQVGSDIFLATIPDHLGLLGHQGLQGHRGHIITETKLINMIILTLLRLKTLI
jgi:hypothetical protein